MDTQRVQDRLSRKRKILFAEKDPGLVDLKAALERLSRREIVLWAFECCEPQLDRPELHEAYTLVTKWARGEIKMPQAKRAILAIHSLAGEADELAEELRLRALAQGLSTVHTPTHAMGLPLYSLSSLVYRTGTVNRHEIDASLHHYHQVIERVKQMDIEAMTWADFL